jgi:hypothetical protein
MHPSKSYNLPGNFPRHGRASLPHLVDGGNEFFGGGPFQNDQTDLSLFKLDVPAHFRGSGMPHNVGQRFLEGKKQPAAMRRNGGPNGATIAPLNT